MATSDLGVLPADVVESSVVGLPLRSVLSHLVGEGTPRLESVRPEFLHKVVKVLVIEDDVDSPVGVVVSPAVVGLVFGLWSGDVLW